MLALGGPPLSTTVTLRTTRPSSCPQLFLSCVRFLSENWLTDTLSSRELMAAPKPLSRDGVSFLRCVCRSDLGLL